MIVSSIERLVKVFAKPKMWPYWQDVLVWSAKMAKRTEIKAERGGNVQFTVYYVQFSVGRSLVGSF